MFQFKMKSIIEQTGIKNPTLLHYEIGDIGVDTVTGLIPNIRYFCHYNNDNFTEIKEEQAKCIEERCADYIIAKTKFENFYPEFTTYDHQGAIVGMGDVNLVFYHYYTPNSISEP